MLKLTKDTGARPEIVGIKGFFTFGDLDRSPRDDEPVPLEAYVHVVLLHPWEIEYRGDR